MVSTGGQVEIYRIISKVPECDAEGIPLAPSIAVQIHGLHFNCKINCHTSYDLLSRTALS